MGKWAQYQKRGSAGTIGTLPPPLDADWILGTITATTAQGTRVTAAPLPATLVQFRVRTAAGGAWFLNGSPVATTGNFAGLTTATAYVMQMAWASPTGAISDWSVSKPFTTP
jgi:hypothetical protein